MTVIKIEPLISKGHDNQTIYGVMSIPDGWAVIPERLGTPETLENFPFGEIAVEDVDGVPTVTSWTPLPVPEPEPEPTPEPEPPTLEERVAAVETEQAALAAAIERGLSL